MPHGQPHNSLRVPWVYCQGMKEKAFTVLQRVEQASKQANDYAEAIDETVPPLFALTEQMDFRAGMLLAPEIRYGRLFEATRDGILILDPGTRKITDANPFISELLGYQEPVFPPQAAGHSSKLDGRTEKCLTDLAVWLRAEKQSWLSGVSLRPLGVNKSRWENETTSPCSCLPGELYRTPRPAGVATCTRATVHSCISQAVGTLGLAPETLSTDDFPTGAKQNCPRAIVAGKPVAGFSGATTWSRRSSDGLREASTAHNALKVLHRQEWTPNERGPDCCQEERLRSHCRAQSRKNTKLCL